MANGKPKGGGKGGGGHNGGGVRDNGDDRVLADMWECPKCRGNSFLSRPRCYICGIPRPRQPIIVSEAWPAKVLGKGGGVQTGAYVGKESGQRAPILQWSQSTAGGRLKGKASEGKRSLHQRKPAEGDKGGKGKGEGNKDDKGTWADMVRSGKPAKNGAKPKAAAVPPPQEGGGGEKGESEDDSEESDEEMEAVPAFQPPINRTLLNSRVLALQEELEGCAADPSRAGKTGRVTRTLEMAKEQLREAGGGSAMRSYFSMVNSNKKLQKLRSALEKAHKDLDEAGGQIHKWKRAEKKCIANTMRLTREVENETQRQAYLSLQSAQEAGEQAHLFEGLRGDVETIRAVIQQVQRHEVVPNIDRLYSFVAALDAPKYDKTQDPILLGLDASDGDESDQDSVEEASVGAAPMDEDEVKKGKKRLWADRWQSAEDRDGEASAPIEVDKDLGRDIEKAQRSLQRDSEMPQYLVEANRQMAEQERMQEQQDLEAAALHAAARITGTHVPGAPPAQAFLRNPRLDLATHRRPASTPRCRVVKRDALPARGGTRRRREGSNSRSRNRESCREDEGL